LTKKNNNNVIAIIPARSGSIEACLKSKRISKIFVSTDSSKYARIAKKFGPIEILYRPKNLSLDYSTDYEMIVHAINNIDFDYEFIAHIRPTAPLRKASDLDNAIKAFFKSKCNSLRSVHQMSESSYKSVEINNGFLRPLKNLKLTMDDINAPRQGFNKTYTPNGVIDIYRKKFIIDNKLLFGKKVKAYETCFSPEIDNIDDFKYIEFLSENK